MKLLTNDFKISWTRISPDLIGLLNRGKNCEINKEEKLQYKYKSVPLIRS